MYIKCKESTADLHVVAALVTGLAALALGDAVGADLAIDDVAGIGAAIGAFGIGLFLDHQFGTVPTRLGRGLADRAVLLDEGDLALALVVERVGGTQVALTGCGGKPGARAPVALQEGDILFLLGFRRHDHRLGLVLGGRVLVLVFLLLVRTFQVALVDVLLVRPLALILAHVLADVLARIFAEILARVLALVLAGVGGDLLAGDVDVGAARCIGRGAAFDRRAAAAHDHASRHDDA